MSRMKGLTIKLPADVAQRLQDEAQRSGRSMAAIVRDRLAGTYPGRPTVFAAASGLAGSLAGPTRSATNARKKFRRP